MTVPSDRFLRIGGMTIAFHCADASVTWEWDAPTSRFLVPPGPADVDISITTAPPPSSRGELLFDSGAVWQLFRDGDGYRIDCHTPLFGDEPYRVVRFDESFTRGELFLAPAAAAMHVNPFEYPLDEVLIANLLGRGRGVELHSCGIIDKQGRGRLFVGMSGAGKSTTARLWGDDAAGIVSDDRVIVRQEDGAFWMYGSPWHGEAELSLATRVPLADVYLLVQAESNEIRPLPRPVSVARLFGCTFPLFYDEAALSFTLEFLDRLGANVPVRELLFTSDRAAVDLVLREEG
ncbi:MAG TPA: hypothetical protein VGQ36_04130 [Thermoanaerobaculia bacterium]|nr:hypothetical protein [Thermoanaerobaculia bacterium]